MTSIELDTGEQTLNPGHVCTVVSRGGGTLGISGWGCAAGTLEPLAFTRAFTRTFTRESFRWIFLPYTRVNSPNHSYPRVLPGTKNSPKRVLTLSLDASFRFSTPNPGRVAAGVAGYMLRPAAPRCAMPSRYALSL